MNKESAYNQWQSHRVSYCSSTSFATPIPLAQQLVVAVTVSGPLIGRCRVMSSEGYHLSIWDPVPSETTIMYFRHIFH